MIIWYIFSGYGTMHQEKSGNPGNTFHRSIAVCGLEEILGRNV
jgi:hypothetical protein